MRVRITRSAEEDLLLGFAFYDMQQEGIGSYFLDSLYADINSLPRGQSARNKAGMMYKQKEMTGEPA